MLLVKISQAVLQMKWLLGTRWSVLWVIYHFMELDGPSHSRDEHEVRNGVSHNGKYLRKLGLVKMKRLQMHRIWISGEDL